MPIFNCFFKIIWKNKTSILIYIGIFAALGFMLSANSSSNQNDVYKDTSIEIAVIDRDGSSLSKALTDYLDSRHDLIELEDDTEKLQDALFYRNVEYILFIPAGFEKNLTNGSDTSLENVKLPKSTSGTYIDRQIDRYISTINVYLDMGYELSDAAHYTENDLQAGINVEIHAEKSEKTAESGYYFNYLAYILTAVIISALGPVLILLNQNDLVRRTESSSLTLKQRNLQIALGCVVSALAIWIVLIVIPFLIYGNEMFTVTSALRILNNLVYLAIGVSIAFLLGQLMKTTAALGALNNALSLGMSFICGIFVPQELLGSGVLSIAKFLPAYWYIRSNDMLMAVNVLNESNKRLYTEGIIIQIGFAAAIFAVALVISRQKKINSII